MHTMRVMTFIMGKWKISCPISLARSVSHPNGSMSKSGQEFPFKPFPPIVVEKSLVQN